MTEKQKRVYDLLSNGKRYSVLEITIKTRIADPRSVIRTLRQMGIIILDEWKGKDGAKYKRYWINQEGGTI